MIPIREACGLARIYKFIHFIDSDCCLLSKNQLSSVLQVVPKMFMIL